MHCNTGPARFRLLREKGIIRLIHGSEVLHVGQENVDLDNVVDAAPCSFEDFRKVG
jgi:hypothetical protein